MTRGRKKGQSPGKLDDVEVTEEMVGEVGGEWEDLNRIRVAGEDYLVGEGGGIGSGKMGGGADGIGAFVDAEVLELGEWDGRHRVGSWRDGEGKAVGERERQDWDRMRGEGAAAYTKFVHYLMMPPTERTMAGAYRAFLARYKPGEKRNVGSCPPSWHEVAREWKWDQRVEAYDLRGAERYAGKMEEVRSELEQELLEANLTALRACVRRVKFGNEGDMPYQLAIGNIPRLTAELREQLGLAKNAQPTLSEIIGMLPQTIRQPLLQILVGTVNVTTGDGEQVKQVTGGEWKVVEGEELVQ